MDGILINVLSGDSPLNKTCGIRGCDRTTWKETFGVNEAVPYLLKHSSKQTAESITDSGNSDSHIPFRVLVSSSYFYVLHRVVQELVLKPGNELAF